MFKFWFYSSHKHNNNYYDDWKVNILQRIMYKIILFCIIVVTNVYKYTEYLI